MFIEPDIFHMYNARGRFPNPDGSLWDPISYMQNNWKRLVGWHVKDANRTVTPVAPPGNAWEQTAIRPGFPLAGGVDVIYSTEGHLGNGAAAAAQPGIAPVMYGFDPGAKAPSAQPGPTRGSGASGGSSRRSGPTAPRASSTTSWSPTAVPARPPISAVRCGTPSTAPSSSSGSSSGRSSCVRP